MYVCIRSKVAKVKNRGILITSKKQSLVPPKEAPVS